MIESVKGNSLNNLFSNMVAFYFPMQRSGACNAFDYFYLTDENDKVHLYDIKYYSRLQNLNTLRKNIITQIRSKIQNS